VLADASAGGLGQIYSRTRTPNREIPRLLGHDGCVTDSTPEPQAPPQPEAPAPAAPQTDGSAIVALLLAIASWLILPVILAIAALVVARSADTAIASSAGAKSGGGLVKAAKVVAWLNLIIWGLVIVFGIAFLVGLAIGN
jgi:hypothetical protein